jgi:hypothetical protein
MYFVGNEVGCLTNQHQTKRIYTYTYNTTKKTNKVEQYYTLQ